VSRVKPYVAHGFVGDEFTEIKVNLEE